MPLVVCLTRLAKTLGYHRFRKCFGGVDNCSYQIVASFACFPSLYRNLLGSVKVDLVIIVLISKFQQFCSGRAGFVILQNILLDSVPLLLKPADVIIKALQSQVAHCVDRLCPCLSLPSANEIVSKTRG